MTRNDLRRWARALQGQGATAHETVPLEPSCPRKEVGDALMRYADCWDAEVTALRIEVDQHRAALGQRDKKVKELRAEVGRLREIEANVDAVTADWALHCQELERLLAERVDDHTADLTRLTRERDEARAENERLREALKAIKRHQRIAGGSLSAASATFLIADAALRGEGE